MADRSEVVEKVREFNRFYMPVMRLLGNHYLGSEYSAAEARILFEIDQSEGCNAAHIAETMQIDKSYLSKILAGHEKNGLLRREPSVRDRRSYDLYLTPEGKRRAEELIGRSNGEIGEILRALSGKEQQRLAQALDTIMELLRKGGDRNESSAVSRKV